jgi:hypothetical protein
MSSIDQFISFGAVGDLTIGMQRQEVIVKMGLPKEWAGKPPNFGDLITVPEESDVWFYYSAAVGIKFAQDDKSTALHVIPARIEHRRAPFEDWPIGPGSTIQDFRTYLLTTRIPFREATDDESPYYILANNDCLALGFTYEVGRGVDRCRQRLEMIQKYARADDLPGFVRRLGTFSAGHGQVS